MRWIVDDVVFDEGEVIMFVVDIPDGVQNQSPIAVMTQTQNNNTSQETEKYLEAKICMASVRAISTNDQPSGNILLGSLSMAAFFTTEEYFMKDDLLNAKLAFLEFPKHGKIIEYVLANDSVIDYYNPDPGYFGKDKVVTLVEIKAYTVKLEYYLTVTDGNGYNAALDACKESVPGSIIMPPEDDPYHNNDCDECFTTNDVTNWYGATSLQALLTGVKEMGGADHDSKIPIRHELQLGFGQYFMR